MKHKMLKKWHSDNSKQLILYFAQRFDELFFDFTLDTYKPPALNCVSLCREALEIISDIESELIDKSHLDHVLEELKWSLSADIVAKAILNAPPEKYIIDCENSKLVDTKVRLEILERNLNPIVYIGVTQDLLLDELRGGSKKKINDLAVRLASTLINMGIEKQHIFEKIQFTFFNGKEDFDFEDVKEFFELISPTSHQFSIFFIASKHFRTIESSLDPFLIRIIDLPPAEIQSVAQSADLTPNSSEVWLEVLSIEAYDKHAARKLAVQRLDMARDLFLLFSHKNKIFWRQDIIISQCCDALPAIIREPKNIMEKCFKLKLNDASQQLYEMIKRLQLTGNARTKFFRSIYLHAVSATNDLPENQLLNLWIAIETLVPSNTHGGGKVVKIRNGLMPILLKNYFSRLIQWLADDLLRWNTAAINRIIDGGSTSSTKDFQERILDLIALPEHDENLKHLYKELDNFHLLRFRVFEISEIFRKPKSLIEKLREHEKKVDWQLRRLYRTRNLIVHSGRTISFIDSLIENAHDYLDQAINSILDYSCGFLSANSLEQAFDMARIDYEVFDRTLRGTDSFTSDNISFLLNQKPMQFPPLQ